MAVIAAAAGVFYGGLESRLEAEQNDQILSDYLETLSLFIGSLEPQEPAVHAPHPAHAPHVRDPGEHYYVFVRVLDPRGSVLLETPGLRAELPLPAPAELTRWSERGERTHFRSRSERELAVLSARVSAPGAEPRYLQIALDLTEENLLHKLRDRSWILVTLCVLGCAVLGYTVARRNLAPVERISQSIQRIHSTRLHERIDTAGLPRELSGLAHTFNAMLDRLEESFERISAFSDNAAHELRTPMSNLRSEIEVALSQARSEADYRDVLASCLEECNRISHITQSLLFLARAESQANPLQLQQLNVLAQLQAVRDFYEGVALDANVKLEIGAPPQLAARLDRTLFRQALGNLVSNAIEHSPRSGACVRICAAERAGALQVSVADEGSGIAPEHLPHVFERFYRADPARGDSRAHAGLGLAIVKSIVARHGGAVQIESSGSGAGTRVTIELPSAAS
jgi:two-component system heavy metal sensor histidine kinase CusS